MLIQLLAVLVVVFVSTVPVYSLEQHGKHVHELHTAVLGVVKDKAEFDKVYPVASPQRAKIEMHVSGFPVGPLVGCRAGNPAQEGSTLAETATEQQAAIVYCRQPAGLLVVCCTELWHVCHTCATNVAATAAIVLPVTVLQPLLLLPVCVRQVKSDVYTRVYTCCQTQRRAQQQDSSPGDRRVVQRAELPCCSELARLRDAVYSHRQTSAVR